MNPILEVVLVLLAAAGLLGLGWVLFGRLVCPVGSGGVYAVMAELAKKNLIDTSLLTCTGKTVAEATGIAVTEEGNAGDADLAASVTIGVGDFLTLVEKAGA